MKTLIIFMKMILAATVGLLAMLVPMSIGASGRLCITVDVCITLAMNVLLGVFNAPKHSAKENKKIVVRKEMRVAA